MERALALVERVLAVVGSNEFLFLLFNLTATARSPFHSLCPLPPALYPVFMHSVLGYYSKMCWWSSMSNRPRSTHLRNRENIQQNNRKEQRADWLRQPSDTQQQSSKKVTASGQFSDSIFPRHLGFGTTSSPFGGGTTGSGGGGLFGNTSSSFGSGGGMHLHEIFPFAWTLLGFLRYGLEWCAI